MRSLIYLLASLASSIPLLSTTVEGHAMLLTPTPRVVYQPGDYPAKNYFPVDYESCSGASQPDPGPLTPKVTWTAGQTVMLEWSTTIPHAPTPGVRVSMKYSETDKFENNLLVKGLTAGPDGFNGMFITLPQDKSGSNSVLQWIWESTEDGGFYIACVDVNVQPYNAAAITPPNSDIASRVNTVFRTRDLNYALVDPQITTTPSDPDGYLPIDQALNSPVFGTKSVVSSPTPTPTTPTPTTPTPTTPTQSPTTYQPPLTQQTSQNQQTYSQGNIISSAERNFNSIIVISATAASLIFGILMF